MISSSSGLYFVDEKPYRASTRMRETVSRSTRRLPVAGWPEGPIGERNVVWGWCAIILGAATGGLLGLWSFAGPVAPPPGFEAYQDLPRRLVRLAHVALFMLPIINILIGKELDGLGMSDRLKQLTSWLGITAMILIPFGLIIAAVIHPNLQYVSWPGASALLTALSLVAYGKVRAVRARRAV